MTAGSIEIRGGSLSGTGTINGEVIVGGVAIVLPDNSAGTLTINGTFSSGGGLLFEFGGLESGLYDVLRINGDAIFAGGSVAFDFLTGFTPAAGNYWDFLLASSIVGWDTLAFFSRGLPDGIGWDVIHREGGERLLLREGNSDYSDSVPELSTILMLVSGLLGLAGAGRKALRVQRWPGEGVWGWPAQPGAF